MSALRSSISLLLGVTLGFAVVHAASPLSIDPAEKAVMRQAALDADIVRSLLVGEFAQREGQNELARQAFLSAAEKGRSAEAAGRAFDIAQESGDEKGAEEAFRLWTELDPNNRQIRLGKVQELYAKGAYDEAAELVRGLAAESNDPAGALLALANLQNKSPEKDRFYRSFVKAAADLTEDPRAQLVLSALAARARMTPEAAEHATKAMDLAPDAPHVIMQAIDAEFQDNPKKAVERLRAYLKRHPHSYELRLVYAKSLLRTSDLETLRGELRTLEKARGDDAHALMLLGMIAEDARFYGEAERYYKRYLAVLPRTEKTSLLPDTAYVRLGMVKLAQGLKAEAVTWLDRVEAGDKYEAARIKQIGLLIELNRIDEACRVLLGIRTSDTRRRTEFDVACADLLLKKNRVDDALAVLKNTLKKKPADPDLLYKTAILAAQHDRFADSEQLFARYIEENPDDANGWNALGYLWVDRAMHLDKAELYLEKAMKLSEGKDPLILDSVGWLRYRQGRLEEAEKLVRKAQYASPADTEITLHLAEILYVLGRSVEADGFIASVLEGEPNNAKAKELRAHRGPAK